MNKKIEFFFDVGSPTAYLAWSQLQSIASRHEAVLEYRPILLGGLFKTIGNVTRNKDLLSNHCLPDDTHDTTKQFLV